MSDYVPCPGVAHPDVVVIVTAHRFVRRLPSGVLPARAPDGTRWCGWCRGALPGRRLSWCSKDCADEFGVRFYSSTVQARVHERDRGICALCRTDTDRLAAIVSSVKYLGRWSLSPEVRARGIVRARRLNRWLLNRGWTVAQIIRREDDEGAGACWEWQALGISRLWEADHVVPVVEGGGVCGLDGLRTLCLPCHRAATAELRARLSARRRGV